MYELTVACARETPPRHFVEAAGFDFSVKVLPASDWPAMDGLFPLPILTVVNVARAHEQSPSDLWAFAKALADAGAGAVLRREPMMMPACYTIIYHGRGAATDAQGLAALVTAHREADQRAHDLELHQRAGAVARWKPDPEAEDWRDVREALTDEPDKGR